MKCTNCGKREADFCCDCLKVEHEVTILTLMNTRATREQVVGVETVGLCGKCRKKLIWKHRTALTPGKIYGFSVLILVLGLMISFVGYLNSTHGDGSQLLLTAGLAVALLFCVFVMVYDCIVVPAKLRKTPYKVLGRVGADAVTLLQEGKHTVYVPLGEGFYKDEKDFARVNGLLMEDARKKIYENLIKTGAWRQLTVSASMPREADPDGPDAALLKESVDRLLALYRRTPEGFLREQADEVRDVGRLLNEAGGMELMLQAHRMFQTQNPRMARNLEIVWDGIGNWLG